MSKRTWILGFGLAALAAYGWLAVRHYTAEIRAEQTLATGSGSWIVGPSGTALEGAAMDRVAGSIARLNDRSLQPAERIRGYRESLQAAESLLLRSLRARPTRAWGLAQLAAVRWELDPPQDLASMERHLETIEQASAMAPNAPGVQIQLGELMLEMGRTREALGYYHRAVDLEPAVSRRVVEALRVHPLTAFDILEGLPRLPQVLAALAPAFREDGDEERYLIAIERGLGSATMPLGPRLLSSYGDACLRTGQPERLEMTLDRVGEQVDPAAEAERLRQRGRARLELGDTVQALADVRLARRRSPDAAELAVDEARVLELSNRLVEAVETYREALGLMARAAAGERARARVYGLIGRAEERRGNMSAAYDAYRLAVRLDPTERISARSLARMEAAAGLR